MNFDSHCHVLVVPLVAVAVEEQEQERALASKVAALPRAEEVDMIVHHVFEKMLVAVVVLDVVLVVAVAAVPQVVQAGE